MEIELVLINELQAHGYVSLPVCQCRLHKSKYIYFSTYKRIFVGSTTDPRIEFILQASTQFEFQRERQQAFPAFTHFSVELILVLFFDSKLSFLLTQCCKATQSPFRKNYIYKNLKYFAVVTYGLTLTLTETSYNHLMFSYLFHL